MKHKWFSARRETSIDSVKLRNYSFASTTEGQHIFLNVANTIHDKYHMCQSEQGQFGQCATKTCKCKNLINGSLNIKLSKRQHCKVFNNSCLAQHSKQNVKHVRNFTGKGINRNVLAPCLLGHTCTLTNRRRKLPGE